MAPRRMEIICIRKMGQEKADGGDCGDDDDGDVESRPIHILPIVVVIVVG